MAYRILVAEDDGDIVQVLKLYLNNEGYEVLHAPNGAEALEIMEQQPADLCIFDIMMPRMMDTSSSGGCGSFRLSRLSFYQRSEKMRTGLWG